MLGHRLGIVSTDAFDFLSTWDDLLPRQRKALLRERVISERVTLSEAAEVWFELEWDVEAYGKTISAEGLYSPQGKTLKLATELPSPGAPLSDLVFATADMSKTRDEAFARLVTHEYGHHIHMSTGFNSAVDNVVARAYREAAPQAQSRAARNELPNPETPPEGAPSRYGTANRYEFWAESFTSYHFDRTWLKANKPVAYKMVETVLELLNR